MRRDVLLYGLVGAVLIAVLQLVEFRWIIIEHSMAIYGGLVAVVFAGTGLWLGLRLTRPTPKVVVREVEVLVPAPAEFVRDEARVDALGLTPRELEILDLMAAGLSNQEIAERLFVSVNTVKTHSSRVFEKLEVRRRTQAVQQGKALRLIP
ncbi:MAG: helix-turn-helix transcriptional regulator [Gemmatimonadetes bacterium]|nr:helix-turn-helix transcriptional regulator [Gemmatimonadota bacterium]MCB9505850.1 helix-turn-helix transcriptional regulator [Gemmatimonadales bacterium]MCB9517590.1 helix-turn-helix transcriptional regulator [Gemmatimonadales bacterium]HRX17693.1 helix-turn-helix transcriptional regulator [Gemmatimonadales bacterium]